MENPLSVFAPGTQVKLGGEVEAMITGISIREKGIMYECVWWNGRTREEKWVSDLEIDASFKRTLSIGFHRNGVAAFAHAASR